MNIAQSSLEELRYYFMLANDLQYMKTKTELASADEVGRMLDAYTRAVLSSVS